MNGWKAPITTTTIKNVTTNNPKPPESWNVGELELAKWNLKGLNAIQVITKDEFNKIATCETSKKA